MSPAVQSPFRDPLNQAPLWLQATPTSGSATPPTPTRKKISLSDYKSKKSEKPEHAHHKPSPDENVPRPSVIYGPEV